MNLPSFLLLNEQSFYLKIIWRYLIVLITLGPFLLMDFMESVKCFIYLLNANFVSLFILSIIHMAYVYLIYYAASQTFVVHVLLLSGVPTMFTTVWKIVRRLPFTRIEYIGIGIDVFGIYLCCCESKNGRNL